uniref:Uncharacterized protein n=1 Tax=Cyanothece sp. (strain PCC 7425 / ATCC 29141) TaxID=395961 RepID=B8HWC9_CYAP4
MLKTFRNPATLRVLTGLVGGLVLAGGLAAMNMANAGIRSTAQAKPNDASSKTPRAIGGAVGSERLLAFVSPGTSFSVVRSKAVSSVTRPSTGQYCIQPSVTTIDVNKIVPVVTVDWSNSSGDNNTVQYRSSGNGCPSGTIAILTFAFNTTTLQMELSNSVAFTLQVP